MAIEKGSMREAINSVYQKLINDEELLRLLWYLPKRTTGIDPLAPAPDDDDETELDPVSTLPNIIPIPPTPPKEEESNYEDKMRTYEDKMRIYEDKTRIYWDIVDQRIMLIEKVNDLEENPICRLYITAGRRRGVFSNYLLATQEIVINVYTHEDYEVDMRSIWISDRINELLALEKDLTGVIGHLDYVAGNARVAPIQYKRYEHIYEYATGKK